MTLRTRWSGFSSRRKGGQVPLLCALAVLGACSDPPGPNSGQEPEPSPLPRSAALISSSVHRPAASSAAVVVGSAYVSMAPGTAPDGQRVDIHNLRSGASASAPMNNGGFDPIAVPAEAADTLSITVVSRSDYHRTTYGIVPLFAKPRVVRASPAMGRTDVPLNSLMLVVFSQPMDSATLSDALELRHDGVIVPGKVSGEVTEGVILIGKFTPDSPLAPLSTYELSVSTEAQSLDGTPIDAPLTIQFETTSSAGPPGPTGPGVPATGLTFVREGTVFISGLDGSNPVALVTEAARPAWSPDGRQLAFTRPLLAKWQLCIAREDGSDVRCVTGERDGYVVGGPSWSPDGAMVAFSYWTHDCPGGQCGQFGGYMSSLSLLNTLTMKVEHLDTSPVRGLSWSPDGRKIAVALFSVGTSSHGAVGTVNPDGSGLEILATSLGSYEAMEVAWSPDASRLALALWDTRVCPWLCDTVLGVINADGTQLTLLDRARTSDDLWLWAPAWSPEGARLAYTISLTECAYDNVPCGSNIAVVGVDGGPIEVLMPAGGYPSWRE